MKTSFHWRQFFADPPSGYPIPSPLLRLCAEDFWKARFDKVRGHELLNHLNSLEDGSRLLNMWNVCSMQWWLLKHGPTIFPSLSLYDAALHTDILSHIEGSDIRVTYPSLMFVLPTARPILSDDSSSRITHVIVNIVDNSKPLSILLGGRTVDLVMPSDPAAPLYILVSSYWDNGFVSSMSFPLRHGQSLHKTIEDNRAFIIVDTERLAAHPSAIASERAETDRISSIIASLVLNWLLMMQSYPSYIEHRPCRHNSRAAISSFSAYLQPPTASILPSPSPLLSPPSTSPSSSRGPASLHWRRGHWRRQPHSPAWEADNPSVGVVLFPDGRRAHMVHIPPVLIGAPSNA